jgi:hypothetical protein
MNRIARNRLLLLVALTHLLMDAGFAGGAVLCVGSDEHRAVESEIAAELGCPVGAPGASRPNGVEALPTTDPLSSGECVDRPLHSEAELVSSHAQDVDPSPVVGVRPLAMAPATRAGPTRRPRARAPRETAAYRAVRTTVLIL